MFNHLKDIGAGYFEHAIRAFGVVLQLLIVAMILTIHAFVPCLFEKTATTELIRLGKWASQQQRKK